jgi:3-oxoacyl-(acyl-carrier-protein) synthase/3-hydroxymyristoyl/3-hydroxydecanoyl-(acyl carrier protein) dehydratase/1-acyl-sn-glycerol-3-phosphate acyltransferase
MDFQPIAVVGQACVLPGALTPEALWEAVAAGRDLVSSTPADRWGVGLEKILCRADEDAADRAWSDRGGYVRGFEGVFDPEGFKLPAEEIRALDPLFQWVLHTARQALAGAAGVDRARTGAIFGNLSFPSGLMARYAESVWLGDRAEVVPHPRNRFMSGLPALVLARALGLGGGAFALDAACASSLYAIKLACDKLNDGEADVMLAGAVNRADDLFIHVGFCALSALSKTGRSRPFHRGADGLVPAEGAAFVALKRLADAEARGDEILGVIRGVGLSNDGRGRGFLAPSAAGQARAMRRAYEVAGVSPAEVTLLECHATGTPVGDATEIRSMAEVFQGREGLPIGSLKSNLGHLITTAGAAGLIKLLGAMRHGLRPPSLHADTDQNEALAGSLFRVLTAPEPWEGRRLAGLSAFGFGGNNAHLIVEQYTPGAHPAGACPAPPPAVDLAVVGLEVIAADGAGTRDFARDLLEGRPAGPAPAREIALEMKGLKFPPLDMKQALPMQVMLLRAARQAVRQVAALDPARTAALVGAQADPEVGRYGLRWRLAEYAGRWFDGGAPAGWLGAARDGVVPLLRSPGVLGTMPNIPANRLNSQFDLTAPGYTVAAEQLSGLAALEVAARDLRAGELDAAVVGAVDLACEPVHAAAAAALLPPGEQVPGDAAVVLVIKRADDARRDGDRVLALLPGGGDGHPADQTLRPADLAGRFGTPHAAAGLLTLAAAVLACRERVRITPDGAAAWSGPGPMTTDVEVTGMEGASARLRVREAPTSGSPRPADPAGPQLTFPAHLPPVEIPAMPARPSDTAPTAAPSGAQRMAPAPALPPVMATADLPPSPPPAAPVAAPVAAAPAATAPIAAPLSAGPAPLRTGDPLLDGLAAQQAQIAGMHRDFLARQTEVTRRFLASRASAMEALTQMMGAPQHAPSALAAAPSPAVTAAAVAAAPIAAPIPPVPATPAPANGAYTNGGAHGPGPIVPAAAPATPSKPAGAPAARPTPSKPAAAAPVPAAAKAPAAAAPAPTSAAPAGYKQPEPVGMTLSREQLKVHASGAISEIFGPVFAPQDGYHRQVRMPEPPLLLADRMVGLDAEPGSMGKGTIWTETDVHHDSWYLNEGYMPAGIMIESGQADLMLISYLGVDLLNKSDRVYRLLGCELTYHGGLPAPGDTLRYDIHVDGHANQGAIRLFFFHYDCCIDGAPRLTVRQGQAGFFTDAELADSMGVLWSAETGEHKPAGEARVDAPAVPAVPASLSSEQLAAFSEGRTFDAFGPGYELAQTHNRTPRVQGGDMLLLQKVTHLDPAGGPWKRGYLRATWDFTPEDWFFEGHFKNDPCMPGTLMFEGCLQAMSLYLAAMGYTLDRDGWRFEPVPDEPIPLRCRGQAIPSSKQLIYEIFVEEVFDGPIPTLYADLLCTVDGLKAFHARRMGLRLVPDWPVTSKPEIHRDFVASGEVHKPVAEIAQSDGSTFRFDYASLMACAWGKPSDAFGEMYSVFDGHRRVARLPGPPYHFMTRVTSIEGGVGNFKPGAVIELEYDIPSDAWYFDENGARTMPFAVLLEAALQPCGWLASAVGSALTVGEDLSFRNLDGTGNLLEDLTDLSGTLRTWVKITNISQSAGMIIESFDVQCFLGDRVVYEMKTVFGFFPKIALENQVGVPVAAGEREWLELPANFHLDLTTRPARYCEGSARLAAPMLLMLDRITGWWPEGGAAGLGQLRGEKDVDPAEWFFKAHFFQDPVQPGSLGLEALIQLLQFYMLHTGMDDGLEDPRFEPIELGRPMTWKYRGQVVPKNKRISTLVEVTEVGEDERGRYAVARGILWVDGRKIYTTENMGMRLVSGSPPSRKAAAGDEGEETLDPERGETWLGDHRPTWTLPALPMMSLIDRLAGAAAPGRVVTRIEDARVRRWVTADGGPIRLKTEVEGEGDEVTARVLRWREARTAALSRYEAAIEAKVTRADAWPEAPAPWSPLRAAIPEQDPYASGALFHGPAFQLLKSLRVGAAGASAVLDAGAGGVPRGHLHQALLDAATHAIPHDALHRWDDAVDEGLVAYPFRVVSAAFFGPAPTAGEVRCEVRYRGLERERHPVFELQLIADGAVWAAITLEEVLLPKGPIGSAPPALRRAFLRDRDPAGGLGLSTSEGGETRVDLATIKGSDWLPGTVAAAYGIEGGELLSQVAARDHVARRAGVHPSTVRVADGQGTTPHLPYSRFPVAVAVDGDRATARSTGPEVLDLSPVKDFWDDWFGVGRWPVEDLYYGLMERFLGRVALSDPEALRAVNGRSLLFLGNHQTGVESLLFSILASALCGTPTVTLAKIEHKTTWLGKLIAHCFSYPGVRDPQVITFFDRDDRSSLPRIIGELATEMAGPGKSVMVHVEGTRSHECRTPVQKMSSAFVDMALKVRAPIVPVRFVGGLPVKRIPTKLEFPLGCGRQDYWFGAPILPETLEALPFKERKQAVIDAINALGPANSEEEPLPGDPALAGEAAAWAERTGASAEHAVLYRVLADRAATAGVHPDIQRLLDGAHGAGLAAADTAEGRWLAELARRLYGERGPSITVR